MRILIVTGKLAYEIIKKTTQELEHEVDVFALPVTVAAFITPSYAARMLGELDLSMYELILLPGTVNGDVSPVEEATGVPTFKGTLHAHDIPTVLDSDIKFSKTVSASLLAKDALRESSLREIEESEKHWHETLSIQGGLVIGESLSVSKGLPMRVLAEIVNAPTLSLDTVEAKARYYESMGANLIDVGMLAKNPKPELIPKIIQTIRKTVDLPVSIDTLDVNEIKAAIDTGIDLILSLDHGNLQEIAPHISNEAVVLLPTNMKEGYLPKTPEERVSSLTNLIEEAKNHGIEKIIGDLVAEPLLNPGLMTSLKAYELFHQSHPRTPLLFGIGNAVELIDADTPGVIGSLSALACEVGSSLLHIPEYSDKAKGSVNEALRASHMMFLAKKRGTVIKDLGVDLLILKEKHWSEHPLSVNTENVDIIQGIPETSYTPDKRGWFRIQVDRKNNKIEAIFHPQSGNQPSTIITGDDARGIYQTIIREKLITKLDHAAYLGKELEKAAIALKLGRSYIQEEPLF